VLFQLAGEALEAFNEFKEEAKAQNHSEAFQTLEKMAFVNGLVSCLNLAESDKWAFDSLVGQSMNKKEKPQFCVQVARNGFIPQDLYGGVANIEYHFARIFIIRAREEKTKVTSTLWDTSENYAKSKLFYPEVARNAGDKRNRICEFAKQHVNLSPEDGRQVAFFSLGGLYGHSKAKAGTRPKGTTCILFARSVYQAAGCNMIGPHTSRGLCYVPEGLSKVFLMDSYGYVKASELDKGKTPQRGDLFHIRGDNFKDKDGNVTDTDSSHVGIIIAVADGGKTLTTIEGGASDHVTRQHIRQLVPSNSKHGKWKFADDSTTAGDRPLQGWYSVEQINTGNWFG